MGYFKDYYDRDQDKWFVRKTKSLFDWEKSDYFQKGFSTFFINNSESEKLLKDAYKHACDLRSILNVDKFIEIKLNDIEKSAYSTYNSILVGTKVFDDVNLQPNEQLDVFLGLTLHELSHIKYTDFNIINYIQNKLTSSINNIIEDEYIENELLKNYPGYSGFIGKTKQYFFDKCFSKIENPLMDELDLVVNNILFIIRFPNKVDNEIIKKYNNMFDEICCIIKNISTSTIDSKNKSDKIVKILLKYFKYDPINKKVVPGNLKSSNGQYNNVIEQTLINKFSDILNRINHNQKDTSAKLKKLQNIQVIKNECYIKDNKCVIIDTKDNKNEYLKNYSQIKGDVRKLSESLNKFVVTNRYKQIGMKNGMLDTNKLVEAIQDVQNVYYKELTKVTQQVDICVLIDESGSMNGNKIKNATKSVILINEACKRLKNCDLFIYGHSADNSDYSVPIQIYKYKTKNYSNIYSLGNIRDRSNNKDGDAIITVAELVRNQTNNPVLFFVISDGDPNGRNYTGTLAIEDTKKKVILASKKYNMIITQIAIDSVNSDKMFDNYIHLKDINNLASDLSKYITTKLISQLKTKQI